MFIICGFIGLDLESRGAHSPKKNRFDTTARFCPSLDMEKPPKSRRKIVLGLEMGSATSLDCRIRKFLY
jgi:hypothetical protein